MDWSVGVPALVEMARNALYWWWNWLPSKYFFLWLVVVFYLSLVWPQGVGSWLTSAAMLLLIAWMARLTQLSFRRQSASTVWPLVYVSTFTIWEILREKIFHAEFWSSHWGIFLVILPLLGGLVVWRSDRKWRWTA